MTQHDNHFEVFQPHTKFKHAILDNYVAAWTWKMLMWARAGTRLGIVDAFAGEGWDKAGNPGSPVIIARRASQTMNDAKGKTPLLHDPNIHVFAIEKGANEYRALIEAMEPFRREQPDLISVWRGDLDEHIDEIRRTMGFAPTFYFLDPFGVKGLDASTYPKALAGPHNEIFALFSDIGATRLHGLITAERADPSDAIERILSQPSFFPDEDSAQITAAEAAAARVNEALDLSIPASRQHLTRALGGEEWIAELERVPRQDRPDAFLRLFRRVLLRAGAQYVVAIPMRNETGQRVYSLVHASKSKSGFVAMKEAVCTGLNKGRISDRALERIVRDLSIDLAALVDALKQNLAGVQHPWSGRGAVSGIRQLLLQHTAIFPVQLEELKSMLKGAGILQRIDRKEVCVFPELP